MEYMIFKPSDECGARVRMYTLSSLIKEFNIEDGSILKMGTSSLSQVMSAVLKLGCTRSAPSLGSST